ncbi:MAG TPA: hypothetical protein VHV55_26505 [Pirellulales bacterium]|jgi:hypothetical protein|nr:hypothetical protein [Pirellulales bacterium]
MGKVPSNKVTAGDIQDLAIAVEQLHEETRLLRMAIDELRDDVVWAARQVLATGYHAAGMPPPPPRDPLAPDMPVAAPRERESPANESIESGPYCCDRPKLRWNGDPDSPGVACGSCGYIIAENGSVVIWRDEADEPATGPTATPAPTPEQRQSSLFD